MFNRQAVSDIIHWYQQPQRKPLVIRGARQVGKTTAVRMAGEQLGVPVIEINPVSGRSPSHTRRLFLPALFLGRHAQTGGHPHWLIA